MPVWLFWVWVYHNAMSHLLPLSRVAHLVGVSRSTLQQMIRNDELATFDGMVEMDELLRVFPDVQWEDDGEFKRVEEIKRKAFGKRVYERALPDKEVLAERLFELGKEFASAKSLLLHYDQVFDWLEEKLDEFTQSGDRESAAAAKSLKQWLKQQIQETPPDAERGKALLAQESVMRIMSAHVRVQPSGHDFFVEGNDTLLEAALRAGISLDYGCSNGNCGECKARLVSGQVKKVHPHDYVLSEAEKADGTLLMCSNTAITDVVVEAHVAGAIDMPQQTISTRVKAVEPLGERILALHLTTPRSQRLRFLAGQYVNLSADGASGEYYVASCPCEDRHIEIHIRRDNRPFARKAFEDLRKEDGVTVTGPHGEFVIEMESRRPVLFVAWEDGFAPIKSLVQHAMSLEEAESMHLYWAAKDLGHYQGNLCRAWADALDNFVYVPLKAAEGVPQVTEAILGRHADLTDYDIYAAGPADFLDALRQGATARGLAAQGWHGELVV